MIQHLYLARYRMAVLLGMLFNTPSFAEFNFQTYRNNNSPHFMFLNSIRGGSTTEQSPFFGSVVYHYFRDPIAFDKKEDGKGTLVPGIHSINFAGEYSPWARLSFGLEMPLHQLQYYDRGDTFAFGDLRGFSKITVAENFLNQGLRIGATPSIYLPTGNDEVHLSNSKGGTGLNLSAEKQWGPLIALVNAGVDYFPDATFENIDYRRQIYGGMGLKYQASRRWSLQMEGIGRRVHNLRVGDLYFGGQYQISDEGSASLGASVADHLTTKSDSYRLMLGLKWAPAENKVITRNIRTKIETIQKIETIRDCGPKLFSRSYAARKLSAEELSNFKQKDLLPYDLRTMSLGQKTSMRGKVPVVRSAQTVFAIDVPDLPLQPTVISFKRLTVQFFGSKDLPVKDAPGLFCFLEQKICSGDFLDHRIYTQSANPKFFEGKEPPNDFFMRQISDSQTRELALTMPIEKLLENSTFPDKAQLIYPKSDAASSSKYKTLYFSTASDIYVSPLTHLIVEMSVQSCTEREPEPRVETHKEEEKTIEEEVHE